jgi:hypothetical protein
MLTHACLRCRATRGDGSTSVTPAMPHGRLRYDIHARLGARRGASASAGSRGPVVDSVLIAGHAGTAAAVRGSARESALRRDRRCGVLPGGERGSELAAGADAEFGEDFAQVVGDGGGAEEQLRGDLRVGGAVADIGQRQGAGPQPENLRSPGNPGCRVRLEPRRPTSPGPCGSDIPAGREPGLKRWVIPEPGDALGGRVPGTRVPAQRSVIRPGPARTRPAARPPRRRTVPGPRPTAACAERSAHRRRRAAGSSRRCARRVR